jgi:hypothetical protein
MSDYMDYLARGVGYKFYQDYLNSEHWKVFSAAIRRSRCFGCGKENDLQVHHTTYERLGSELPTDVVTLCGACHTRVHDLVKNGTRLEKAHYSLLNRRRSKSYGSKRGKGWVKQLHDLCNYSLMENPGHVRDFLRQQGYMNPSTLAPTQLAFKVKLAKKRSDGVIWWDKTRYITLTRNYRRACKKQTRSGTRSCK